MLAQPGARRRCSSAPTLLTAFNDNALITYLATLVPNLGDSLKIAVVEGAVTGGGLTVIANAPNPAGQALLARFFVDGVSRRSGCSLRLSAPTVIAAIAFRHAEAAFSAIFRPVDPLFLLR